MSALDSRTEALQRRMPDGVLNYCLVQRLLEKRTDLGVKALGLRENVSGRYYSLGNSGHTELF